MKADFISCLSPFLFLLNLFASPFPALEVPPCQDDQGNAVNVFGKPAESHIRLEPDDAVINDGRVNGQEIISMMNPALVLPVPDTALNRMNDGAMISVEEAITYTELTLAAIRDRLSVKARRTGSGNRHNMMSRGIRMAYVSLRVMPQVLNRQRCSPAPIWLLMRAPAVVAKALITMISRAEILRTMLVTASGRSPNVQSPGKK